MTTITTDAAPTFTGQPSSPAPPAPRIDEPAIRGRDQPGQAYNPDPPVDPPPVDSARATGRLTLVNPGQPSAALPDDIDLEDMLALIDRGGHVTVRSDPQGPPVSTVLPIDDPRLKLVEAGVRMARQRIANRPVQTTSTRVVCKININTIETAHFHGVVPPTASVEESRKPKRNGRHSNRAKGTR
jgi:hypothetical protein